MLKTKKFLWGTVNVTDNSKLDFKLKSGMYKCLTISDTKQNSITYKYGLNQQHEFEMETVSLRNRRLDFEICLKIQFGALFTFKSKFPFSVMASDSELQLGATCSTAELGGETVTWLATSHLAPCLNARVQK